MSVNWQKIQNSKMQLSNHSGSDDFFDSTKKFDRYSYSQTGLYLPQKRLIVIGIIGLCFSAVLVIKLFNYQIVSGAHYADLAYKNRERSLITPARRGVIFDRNGIVLAENTPRFQLVTTPAFRTASNERKHQLSNLLIGHIPDPFVETLNQNFEYRQDLVIMDGIPHHNALKLMELLSEFDELKVEQTSSRKYVTDKIPSLSHILGYVGKVSESDLRNNPDYRPIDIIGKVGVEAVYESELRGQPGRDQFEVNARGQIQRITSATKPLDGQNLTLTIDSKLQAKTEEILQKYLPQVDASKASVVIMNPKNGEILTLVSWPSYDANQFIGGISTSKYQELLNNPDNPLFHRAISGEFPSGSTIKPLYAAAALMENIVQSSTSFLSSGGLPVGPWFFPDWKAGGHSTTNIFHAIADSVNTYFYIIGGGYNNFEGMGVDRLMYYARLFGLGTPTGIDQNQERSGFLPSREWKERTKGEVWYIGDTYNVSIGQGDILVTPLQITKAIAVFANGGHLVQPHLNMAKSREILPEKIVPENHAETIKVAMRQTVTAGTARILNTLSLPVGGKTGTAQWSSNRKNHSWFTGFAPFSDPEIVITVLVEEDGNRGMSVPITRDIIQFWIDEIRDKGTIE
jgi:penicillin-binding protein 2